MKIINPATEEIITEVAEDTTATLNAKYEKLRAFQPIWADVPLKERIACIARFCQLLDEEKDELAKTLTLEVGKPLSQSYGELRGAIAKATYFVENSEKYLAEEWVTPEGGTKEKITYEPLGVVCNISAWNYPYLVGINIYIPALIGGNTVFYKPSEYATLTGLHIERLLKKAGIPQDAFHLALGGPEAGETLLGLPLDGYFFTGSYKTGKYIAAKVIHKLVPIGLELGGKDPLYVCDDVASVKAAAESAVEGVVYNNGQSCCAVERIYVHENIYDEFVKEYVEELKTYTPGDPMQDGVKIGSLARKPQVEFLDNQVKDAVAKGAKLLAGGKVKSGKGYFFEPAVLVDVDHSMSLMKEESFGPIVGIMKVPSDEVAVKMMNDTEYGLTSAVYTADKDRAEKLMKKLNSGTVYWNCCDRVSAALPWSGRGSSGLGSTLSHLGIRAFVQPKGYHLRG